jgi:DNA-directed RNA polymerase subunit RPC12/RpoP
VWRIGSGVWVEMYECARCGEPLDLVEMLNMEINEIDADHVCEVCRDELDDDILMERFWHEERVH